MKPRLLDLFCGAGGAAMGYHRAGFEVVGVDIKPQPNYPFEFVQDDAMILLDEMADPGYHGPWFDAIHASPPCPGYCDLKVMKNAREHPLLIGQVRWLLNQIGLPYVIENVPGAKKHMLFPFQLCGSSFGLGAAYNEPLRVGSSDHTSGWYSESRELRRHRLFETNWPIGLIPPCSHRGRTIGIYGDHLRFGRRSWQGELSGSLALRLGKKAMGVDWNVTWAELKDMVPPDYTEWIGHQLAQHLDHVSVCRVGSQ